ncbi:hypothetical protein [Embleya sp. NPDC059237]|uniref:hypothetical protein n=1 Tax=Embleya sp. NPDC059237 TaxID=3346784 RepID=UPI0036B36876
MTGPAAQEPGYAELITALAAFRAQRLHRQPSDRVLAGVVGVSPTTVGEWLRGDRFPQQPEQLLAVVRAIRAQAERAGLARDPAAVAVLDERVWRHAYRGEAGRRADGTRVAVRAEQGRAAVERMRPGRPLVEVADPFALEVHHAIDSRTAGLPVLPVYVPREHDRLLAEAVDRAAAGAGGVAVLVGGSSTGKTRACWEALHVLREREEGWRLWHPIDPTRPGAALTELADVAPYTVIWLNEVQEYLTPAPHGEELAAGLRALLRDPRRAPVLVLATMWPNHWDTLTTRTDPDRHAQARALLDGHRITVPDAFTGAALDALAHAAGDDPRLAEAAEHATDGRITQYLAGVPVLTERYEDAPPATKALVHAAMDARRLGAGTHLPLAWLAEAAPGYLTDTEWDASGDDWLEQALRHVTQPCKGIPGILTPVKTGTPRNRRTGPATEHRTGASQSATYRLADYLDQHGRRHRAEEIPPVDFWTAAATHAHPADLTALGHAARTRGLYRDAAQLHKHAATRGSRYAAIALVALLHTLHPTDHRPVQWAAAHASLDNPSAVGGLLQELREAGAQDQVAVLLARDPAARTSLDDPDAVAFLLWALQDIGAQDQVAVLLTRDPAARTSLDDPDAVVQLLSVLREVGAHEQAAALATRAATHVPLDDPDAVAQLLSVLGEVGAKEQIAALLARDPATRAPLDNPAAVTSLLWALREVGSQDQVAVLLARDPTTHAPLDNPDAVTHLLWVLQEVGSHEQVAVLLAGDPAARASLDNPGAVAQLLRALRGGEAQDQVAVLLARDPAARASLDNPGAVAQLLRTLREVGAQDQVAVLLARDPATRASLDNPGAVAQLLRTLQAVGAHKQVAVLLARDPATHASLDNADAVAQLLRALQEVGAHEQAVALIARLPAAGHFHLFVMIGNQRDRFWYGREPDGSPAAPWGWADLT